MFSGSYFLTENQGIDSRQADRKFYRHIKREQLRLQHVQVFNKKTK